MPAPFKLWDSDLKTSLFPRCDKMKTPDWNYLQTGTVAVLDTASQPTDIVFERSRVRVRVRDSASMRSPIPSSLHCFTAERSGRRRDRATARQQFHVSSWWSQLQRRGVVRGRRRHAGVRRATTVGRWR